MKTISPHILLIFDIDGTLAFSDGATGRAFGAAFTRLMGVDVGTGSKRPYGMTDPQIFREMLHSANVQVDDFPKKFAEFQDLFIPIMREELANSSGARLLPGVRKLLIALSNDNRFALALGTGNVEASAFEKLRIHNAHHFFPVGGFGSDAEERSDVIRIAMERSQQHWNTQFQLTNTWIIGDTPKDIAAGKSLGAKTMGVASGIYPAGDLEPAYPDAILASLEDQDAFLNIVSG